MNLDEYNKKYDLIQQELIQILNKYFPEQVVSTQNFEIQVNEYNKYYKDTEYYYSDNLEFIHFTSLKSLFSILNEKSIRFYNLHNSNDPDEFLFSAKYLNLGKLKEDYIKKCTYLFSFCPINESNIQNNWIKYAQNFSGVGIQFQVLNNPETWIKYHLCSIKYNQVKNFTAFCEEIRNFENKYLTAGKINKMELGRLICFHKQCCWRLENEVRLLTFFPFNKIDDYEKYSKPDYKLERKRNRFVEYITLKLWRDILNIDPIYKKSENESELIEKQNDYFKDKPQIKITNIMWGQNLEISQNELNGLKERFEHVFKYSYGYSINISPSLTAFK